MRKCAQCDLFLPYDAFYKSKTNAGGLRKNCKSCFKSQVKERRDNMDEDQLEDLKDQIKTWHENHRLSCRLYWREWRKRSKIAPLPQDHPSLPPSDKNQ